MTVQVKGSGTIGGLDEGLVVSGIVTATSLDVSGDIDVDGHTNLDNISIAGVTTSAGIVQASQFKLLDNAKAVYGSSGDMEIYHNATNSLIQNGTGSLQIITTTGSLLLRGQDDISLNTAGNNERLRIDSSGRLLIGTTTLGDGSADNVTIADSGHCGVTIRSGSSNYGNLMFTDLTSGDQIQGYVQYNHSDNSLKFGTNKIARLYISSAGLMGVGTQSPQKNLHLYSTGVTTLRIETGDSRGQAWDILSTNGAQNNTGTLSFRDESGSAYLEFGANEGSPQFRVRNGGANDLLHVDNNGTVTKSKHPIFATKINYVNSYVSSGTKIPMQAAHIDTRSSFSDSNDRYTAPAAGRYLFYFFSNIDYNGDGTIAVRFHRNGSEFTSGEGGHIYSYAQNSGWHGLCGQIITNMAVNDYMEVFTSASNMKVDGNNYGQFGGYMIG